MSATEAKGTALITGASGGIGAIYADRLAKRGYDLILVARNKNRLAVLAQRLKDETGRSVETIAADLNDKADLARIETTLRGNASITLLVNNAGVGATAPLLDSDVEKMDQMIRLNVGALTRLTYAAAPGFVARGGGIIVNIASSVAISPETLNGVYGGSKAFVLALSQSLNHELAGKGVRVRPARGDGDDVLGHRRPAGSQPAHRDRDVGRGHGRRRPRRSRPGRDRHHSIFARQRRVGSVRRSAPRDVRQAFECCPGPPIQHQAAPISRSMSGPRPLYQEKKSWIPSHVVTC
jgi:NADP-dependent 3-hydroxy acid dehydrogenase YdfG